MIRSAIAFMFHILFKISFFKKRYFGFYKHIFNPYNLFKNVKKTVRFRKNLKLTLSIDDWIQQHIYFTGTYEANEILFIEKNLQPGNTFIDIGANIGLFSITASAIVGDNGKVLSFEPFATNYNAFLNNINLNKIKNITAIQKAVAEKEQELNLFYDSTESNLGMVSSYASSHTIQQQIKAVSLDNFLPTININAIDIIKIDIEGGEYSALLGMKATIQHYKPKLIVEIDDAILKNTPYTAEDIYNYMATLNYKPYFINEAGNLINKRNEDDNSLNVVFVSIL